MQVPDLNFTVHFATKSFILIVPMILMLVDILTGFVNAWRNHDIQSSKLRDGIVHKFGEIIIIVLAIFLQFSIGMPKEVTMFASVYIIIMEVISILENVSKMGVQVPEWLTKRLKSAIKDESEETSNE
jgi:toxin secretion/phage lysis holin